jgi:hypothetical protein
VFIIFKRKYSASLPYILDELGRGALEYNYNRTDLYPVSYRCIAFAFNGSTLVDYGINVNKTHPKYKDYIKEFKMMTHAEISLIIGLKYMKKWQSFKKVTDIVLVRGRTKLLDSYPCCLCMKHLHETFSLSRLWYYKNENWNMEIL